MDVAHKFVVNGPNMESALTLLRNGHSVPAALFINIITEKFQLINRHLRSTRDYFTKEPVSPTRKSPLNSMIYILRIPNYDM